MDSLYIIMNLISQNCFMSLCANPCRLGPTLAIVYPQLVDSFFVEKFGMGSKLQKMYTVKDAYCFWMITSIFG